MGLACGALFLCIESTDTMCKGCAMSELDDFMECAAPDGANDAGEYITINGQTILGIFDEFEMSTSAMPFGDKEEISAGCVIASVSLDKMPAQKDTLTRVKDGVKYRVVSVNNDSGHVDLRLNRVGKKQSNGA